MTLNKQKKSLQQMTNQSFSPSSAFGIILLCLIVGVVAFSACSKKVAVAKSSGVQSPPAAQIDDTKTVSVPTTTAKGGVVKPSVIPKDIEENLVFSLRRTPCYGKCPAFEIKVFKDGTATYNGIAHVSRTGKYTAKVSESVLKEIYAKAAAANFFELSDAYPLQAAEISDLPKVYTFVRQGENSKFITNNFDAPPQLMAFESQIEKLLEKLDWKN
jgi:hypothetical protein